MKVILKESVYNLGDQGQVVNVKPGYGRNFLLPRGKAVIATPKSIANAEKIRAAAELREQLDATAAAELSEKLGEVSLTFAVKTNDDGRIFGSVTTQQVADALKEKGYDVDKRKVALSGDVKSLGEYNASISLRGDVKAIVKVWVVRAE